jgi:hypothetical protein
MKVARLAAILLLALAHCSDDSRPGTDTAPPGGDRDAAADRAAEGGATDAPLHDAAVPDAAAADRRSPDLVPGPDQFGTNLPCDEIRRCNEVCGAACPAGDPGKLVGCLMDCESDCEAKGCAAAKPLFTDYTGCLLSFCSPECHDGPGPDCTQCAATKCKDELQACQAQSC